MDTRYSPKSFENDIYKKWERSKVFVADNHSTKPKFSIVLPPPNITGQLHMGHALDHSIPDAIIRYKHLSGYEVLWLPGTDHASIATEIKVWQALEEEGFKKGEVSREDFLKRAWKWKEKHESRIVEQMKKLGSACDWSRLRFTMDDSLNKVVNKVFVDLYNKGLIYKGKRMIHWCSDCNTSLSDAEVEYKNKEGAFYHLHYKLEKGGFIEIATTRPETIFGDTAIAVNPNDDRYKHLIGSYAFVPLVNRKVKIIADEYVDIELGTGALKVTPNHDENDYEIGKRHNLDFLEVIDENGKLNENTLPGFVGLSVNEARKKIEEELKKSGSLVGKKQVIHRVGTCYRCHNVVESRISIQWFVKMAPLAKPALEALNKDLFLLPKRFDKIYTHWLENIQDWCISRQLWWGHRIPAYECLNCSNLVISENEPLECDKCNNKEFKQESDVLDTWFSSALWPFSTLGWPEMTDDYKTFYPTSLLVTGYDILFFWVIRMVFSSIEQTGKTPFKTVLCHGILRDNQGRKMSKSLGNGIDPLEIIDLYGADALRLTLVSGISVGSDIRFTQEKIEFFRNFNNKLWNASRFVYMNTEEENIENFVNMTVDRENLEIEDKWILHKLSEFKNKYQKQLDMYETAKASELLVNFVWNEFCDWYIELSKIRLFSKNKDEKNQVKKVLLYVLKEILMYSHPFIPFITERIWQEFDNSVLMTNTFSRDNFVFEKEQKDTSKIMEFVKAIRNIRNENQIPNNKKIKIFVEEKAIKNMVEIEKLTKIFETLASVSQIEVFSSKEDLKFEYVVVAENIYVPLSELVDKEKEKARLNQLLEKTTKELERVSNKLKNQNFVQKAPKEILQKEQQKEQEYSKILEETKIALEKL